MKNSTDGKGITADPIDIRVYSEYGRLRDAVVGYCENYHRKDLLSALELEYMNLVGVLEENGVRCYKLKPVSGSGDQTTPRDIAFVIGDTFFWANMAESRRQEEWRGLEELSRRINGELIRLPQNAIIEGGDILLDRCYVYVGIGERTTKHGFQCLQQLLPDQFQLEMVEIDAMHLDVVFNIVSDSIVICHEEAIKKIPDTITHEYTLIKIVKNETDSMYANCLAVGKDKVIVREGPSLTIRRMRAEGLDVIEIPFSVVPLKCGGIRCAVLPLRRD